ncbi:T9SS type A sorting domain-containing protein [Winogradskyella psychrotolerans]|uniref:T9SS type A sorting domain-containing protein n=1 Tax=Winogradskyella psychrotolerans TaxID=1344585 RepID=UPI001C066313|nr:T9SS type A sorting domain-containing protein [Winogradskyella psychrotolerans]MBU2927086.1 T9SS type A sorting domain-containing protein [Winogradskyella psychrotolerans]
MKFIKTLLFLSIIFISNESSAQLIQNNFTEQPIGQTITPSYSIDKYNLVLDSEANKIVAGTFEGVAVDFPNGTQQTSDSNKNILIAKYDNNDNLLWLKNVGGTNFYSESGIFPGLYNHDTSVPVNDIAYDVVVDDDDNIYVTGQINPSFQNIDFDLENPETPSFLDFLTYSGDAWGYSGSNFLFLVKYSSNGEYLWSKVLYNKSNLVDLNLSLVDEKIYLSGNVYYSVIGGDYDFDFDIDNNYNDDRDIINFSFAGTGFLTEYNKNGDFLNTLKIGGLDANNFYYHGINSIQNTITNENKYVAITFSGTISLEENGQLYESQGYFEFISQKPDICLVKYNGDNVTQWVKHISGENIHSREIKSDSQGNVYVVGYFEGSSVDFDPDYNDVSDVLTSSTGNTSAFIAKYNPEGKLMWVKDITGIGLNTAYNTIAFSDNHIYVGGQFTGQTRTFGASVIEGTNERVGFIAIYDFEGEEIEFLAINTINNSAIQDMAIVNNYIYTTGKTFVTSGAGHSLKSYFLNEFEITNDLLSIEDLVDSNLVIKVYPNPASQKLYISTSTTEISTVEIFNSLGQRVMSLKPNSFNYSIDISTLTRGLYFVKVNDAIFRQIIKQQN